MAKASSKNNWGAEPSGFLGDLVAGDIVQETPDGCSYPNSMGTWSTTDRNKRYSVSGSGILGTPKNVPVKSGG